VFIGSCNGLFRRLDARTGKVVWETNARGNTSGRYNFHGDVFVASDRVVATADVPPAPNAEAGVHAFDIESGRQLWMVPMGRGTPGAVIGSATRVFVYDANGDLVALDLASGRREWSVPTKASAWESPATAGSQVFAGGADGVVYGLNSETGKVEWRRSVAAPVSTSIRAGEAGVYAGTSDGVIHRLAAASGEILASLKLDAALQPAGAPLLSRDAVLVLLIDREVNYRALVSIDPEARRVNWRVAAPDRWTTTRVFATQHTIVLGTPKGEVMAYCRRDGSPAWSHKLTNAPIRSIGGSEQVLYVGTPQGALYAIAARASCN
jgi:outer membrane protein assembly factor BamB